VNGYNAENGISAQSIDKGIAIEHWRPPPRASKMGTRNLVECQAFGSDPSRAAGHIAGLQVKDGDKTVTVDGDQ
jgi:hypothetical protein